MPTRDLPAAARRLDYCLAATAASHPALASRPLHTDPSRACPSRRSPHPSAPSQLWRGPDIWDSIAYISVARHLLEGEGFGQLTNKELYMKLAPSLSHVARRS